MTTIPQEELQAIFERLAFPSALQLRRAVIAREKARAARTPRPPDYQPWRITLKDARAFAEKSGQRQILAKTRPYDGKIASGDIDERWAADIISYAAQPAQTARGTMKFVLIVQDIFSREIWTRALPEIKAVAVARALREIFAESRRSPSEFNTDGGAEFTGAVGALLKKRGVAHRVAERQNSIATLDAAIYKLRRILARLTATPGKGNWAQELKAATEAYNESPHGAIDDEPPEKVSGDSEESKSLRFDLMRKNAELYAQQNDAGKRKIDRLSEAQAYRTEVKQRQGTGLKRRAYKPTYSEDKIRVVEVNRHSGTVKGVAPDGKAVTNKVSEVMPVPGDSSEVRAPGQGRDARLEAKRREGTRALRDKVHEFLSVPRTTAQVTRHVGAEGVQLIKDNRLQTTARFLELWGFRQDATKRWTRGAEPEQSRLGRLRRLRKLTTREDQEEAALRAFLRRQRES